MRAPRRAKGTKKKTTTKMRIARRAKKVGRCISCGLALGERGRWPRGRRQVVKQEMGGAFASAPQWSGAKQAETAIPSPSSKWERQLERALLCPPDRI